MRIGIIDAELISKKKHRFPNLASMKISAWNKSIGNTVELLTTWDTIDNYDEVYISKVFTDTVIPDGVLLKENVRYGGTGFYYDKAASLEFEIEHCKPDYHLYDEYVERKVDEGVNQRELQYYTDYSIGFTTRGCIRGCSFCVNQNYKTCSLHSPVSEFLDDGRKHICLLDDNIFACKDWRTVFYELSKTGKRFQFKQGMDERLLTPDKCEALFSSKWIGDYIFAFDNIKDKEIIESKLSMIRGYTSQNVKFYCFCGYNHDNPGDYSEEFWANDIRDLFERIRILMKYNAKPYVMKYKDFELSPYRGMYITIARWCNQPSLLKKKSFREFCEVTTRREKAPMQYLQDFESKYPHIASEYFDMKYGREGCL